VTVWHAAGIPAVRRSLLEFIDTGALTDTLMQHRKYQRGPVRTPMVDGRRMPIPDYVTLVRRWVQIADLYYVTEPMSAVVRQAAESMPPYRFLKEDMPSPIGLVVWAAPIGKIDDAWIEHHADRRVHEAVWFRAALWAPATTEMGPGVQVSLFSDTDTLIDRGIAPDGYTDDQLARFKQALGPLAYYDEAALPYADLADHPIKNSAFAAVMTTWLIMGQRIAVVEHERLPRQMRRAAARAGEPEPTVRTITLRRAAKPGQADEDGQGPKREFHHRWIVKGHWRQQWYASEQRHKPIYIADFVKGPEGAPMIGGERVSVLRR
jgi:hypothetical protein